MGEELFLFRDERRARLVRAQAFFSQLAPHWEALAGRARASGRSNVAPLEPMGEARPRPPVPGAYEVLATDGSTIEPDRHGPALCALINIGRARIRYGSSPLAQLDSKPALFFRSGDLYLDFGGKRLLLRERLLDAKRSIAEMASLAELAADGEGIEPRVALADGLLTLWREDWAAPDADAVTREFTQALEEIATRRLPLAAYVSSPASHWVVDLLREEARCRESTERCPLECVEGACSLAAILDVELYGHLQAGQRSGLFEVLGRHQESYGRNRSHFFYLHVGSELARVEVPAWVAEDTAALDLIHTVVCDQAERGQGYPVALARAHEQAVLTGRDRQWFQQLVTESLVRSGLSTGISQKQTSKTVRAV
jgi:hypothetical protein